MAPLLGQRVHLGRIRTRRWLQSLIVLALVEGVRGEILPALNVEWCLRRSVSSEIYVGAALGFQIAAQLNSYLEGPSWRGRGRYLYTNSGRALRFLDGLQHHVLELLTQGKQCTT